jgi:hypothetical protein
MLAIENAILKLFSHLSPDRYNSLLKKDSLDNTNETVLRFRCAREEHLNRVRAGKLENPHVEADRRNRMTRRANPYLILAFVSIAIWLAAAPLFAESTKTKAEMGKVAPNAPGGDDSILGTLKKNAGKLVVLRLKSCGDLRGIVASVGGKVVHVNEVKLDKTGEAHKKVVSQVVQATTVPLENIAAVSVPAEQPAPPSAVSASP